MICNYVQASTVNTGRLGCRPRRSRGCRGCSFSYKATCRGQEAAKRPEAISKMLLYQSAAAECKRRGGSLSRLRFLADQDVRSSEGVVRMLAQCWLQARELEGQGQLQARLQLTRRASAVHSLDICTSWLHVRMQCT